VSEQVLDIPLKEIRAFAGQPRKYFSPDSLKKLAKSIERRGQETPGTVRRLAQVERSGAVVYELIDGERRFRACELAKLATFRAIVCEVADGEDQFERSVVSNFGREGHPPMEIAFAIKRLRARYTLQEIAERVAKSSTWVFGFESLLNLDERVQAMLDPSLPEEKQLKVSMAMRLSSVPLEMQRMTLQAANLYIRRMAAKKGLTIGKPADAHDQSRVIESFIARLEVDSEMVLSARQIDFTQALGNKSFGDLRKLLGKLQICMENVSGIEASVRSVYECREKKAAAAGLRRSA
jgi:ParB family transcriptional regulator, chromosome partitioning protein